ncbi:MAG TPA: ArsA family ATPase [Acidimicrobiales bacterium]|nr:ArsA family ATPase [Acidimicrobiales bacterium]
MDILSFCSESRVLIVAGKGGVGKTTVAATLAQMAADAGRSVLVVELEGKPGIHVAYGKEGPLSYLGSELLSPASGPRDGGRPPSGTVRGRWITPDDALLEYLSDHGLERVSRRLLSSGLVDVVSTAIPGIRDVLVLGKIKQLEREGIADLIVVDAPATGHAVTFLTSAAGLMDAARSGPVRAQAADVVELLTDPARCRVILVSLPEEMPVSETVEAAYVLEDRAGVRLGPVVVNGYDVVPDALRRPVAEAAADAGVTLSAASAAALDAARAFRLRRFELQAEQVERLGRELPLPQLHLPRLDAEQIGPAELAILVDALASEVAALEPSGAR